VIRDFFFMIKHEYNQQLIDYLSGFVTEARLTRFEDIVRNRTRHITVALENIFQPHNASAVLRSCDCFGIQDVHIIENEFKYEVNDEIALGSSKWLTLLNYNNNENSTRACIDKLRAEGYRIIATTPHKNDCSIEELPIDNKLALFFGTELNGISLDIIEEADEFVKIPMFGFTESFNISVSAALSLYELTSRLRKSEINWNLTVEETIEIKLQWLKNSIKDAELLEKEFNKKLPEIF
jgi:tRNA (guanosine-2'-O-)-methyltransferase